MRPLNIIPYSINVTNVDQVLWEIFIPKNTWAWFKRLIVWADVELNLHPPNPGGGRLYNEKYKLGTFPAAPRTLAEVINNAPTLTRFVMERQFVYEQGGGVYEENYNTIGIATLNQVQGFDHRIDLTSALGSFDPTIDNYLQYLISDNNAIGNDIIHTHTAMAYIQAPVNLRRIV